MEQHRHVIVHKEVAQAGPGQQRAGQGRQPGGKGPAQAGCGRLLLREIAEKFKSYWRIFFTESKILHKQC